MNDTLYTVYCDTTPPVLHCQQKITSEYDQSTRDPYIVYCVTNINTPFDNYNTQLLEHLRINPTSIMLLIHDWSPPDTTADIYEKIIKFTNLQPEQYYFVVMDPLDADSIKNGLAERGIYGINFIGRNSLLIDETIVYDPLPKSPEKLFSVFCRSSREWRLHFYCDLIATKLLDECIYSYINASPYIPGEYPTELSEIKKMMPSIYAGDPTIRDTIHAWVDGMPYALVENLADYNSLRLFETISKSYIHIILETMHTGTVHHVTEKTWKAVSVKKPFMLYGVPGCLQWLHKRGYKTFHPYINEDYDLEEDPIKRKDMIICEMRNIAKLSPEELTHLAQNCNPAVEHNHRLFLEEKKFKWPEEFAKLGIFK